VLDLLALERELMAARPGQTLLADEHYYGRQFQRMLGELGCGCCGRLARARPSTRRPAVQAAAADRIGQPDLQGPVGLKRHGGRTGAGVTVRVLQRILALTAVNWHNDKTGQPTLRSLVTDPLENQSSCPGTAVVRAAC
jgi:hypothetical protein